VWVEVAKVLLLNGDNGLIRRHGVPLDESKTKGGPRLPRSMRIAHPLKGHGFSSVCNAALPAKPK
jgi:hypothetical protein